VRIVGPGDACGRFESTCEALANLVVGEVRPSPAELAAMRAHAAGCDACAGAIRAAEALGRARDAFEVPEPDASYWAGFAERLDARLRASGAGAGAAAPSAVRWRALRGIGAAAAAAVLIAGALFVRHALRTAGVVPAEAELLQRLDRAPEDRVAEYLDEIASPDPGAAADDLAEAGDLLHEYDDAAIPSDDAPYDLFFDLGDEDRDHLLKELRGETG